MLLQDDVELDSDYECNSRNIKKKIRTRNQNGFGNVLQKILSQKTEAILSKRKKQKAIDNSKNNDKADLSDDEILTSTKIRTSHHQKTKKIGQKVEWEHMCYIKESIFDREKEKHLQRIATKGVVTLFNSVRKQQCIIEDKLKDAKSVRAKEKFLTNDLSKSKFIDILKSNDKSVTKYGNMNEDKNWKVLRDDFLMEAELKDWDKMSDQETEHD